MTQPDGGARNQRKVKTNHDGEGDNIEGEGGKLTILSLNMEYYQQYTMANDKHAYERYLKEQIGSVDVMCIQEDLLERSDEFMAPERPFDGFRRVVSSFEEQAAHDARTKHLFLHYDEGFTSTLGNSIYIRGRLCEEDNGSWTVEARAVVRIASASLVLPNGVPLGYRCVVCATLVSPDVEKPVQVLCTHLSGGRYEDIYMDQPEMNRERGLQMQRCLDQKNDQAYNILVGDFNATPTRTPAMDGYFQLLQSDKDQLSSLDFYSYMMAPFTTLAANSNAEDWHLLYDSLDGPTSRFGHVVDYFVTSPRLPTTAVERVRMIRHYMDWVTPTADRDFRDSATAAPAEAITDHNGVRATFSLPRRHAREVARRFTAAPPAAARAGWEAFRSWAPPRRPPTAARYPILRYRRGPGEPIRDGAGGRNSLADLVDLRQARILEAFRGSEYGAAAVAKFVNDCAAAESEVLAAHGWRDAEDRRSAEATDNVLVAMEKSTQTRKLFREELICARTLRLLMECSLLAEVPA